jgi:release factor glutamine methyltransferase
MTVVGAGTIGDAVAEAAARLAAAGIEDGRREARLLVALALGVDPAVVWGFPERSLDESARRRLSGFLTRRAAREPLSRLRGTREFWSLDFALSPETLDPRPDSETLIEAALELLPDRQAALRAVDFGTGTGCLLLAFLSEFPNATGMGVDIQPGAVAVARRNAAALGLKERARFMVGAWDEAISGAADVILANPPYIPSKEIETLAPEVALYEPRRALDGGPDGLAAYRILLSASRRLLVPGGLALFETGAGQAEVVADLAVERGLQVRAVKRDLAGIDRCVAVNCP